MIFGIGLLALGIFFGWLASRLWKFRAGGSISILEMAILKAIGEEPLPRTQIDVWLHFFQMVMFAIFGVLLVAVSIYGLLEEAGAI